ncbi:hypothetical protein [Endozoicomonas numazuensis]|uniref:hypothetical protein n=1 Tax=Endozoicomonas numazuensis TaxID=1137799 RepID=UPI001268C1E6|nr:hypothetical protein [Endozoicomonas numazuensis]
MKIFSLPRKAIIHFIRSWLFNVFWGFAITLSLSSSTSFADEFSDALEVRKGMISPWYIYTPPGNNDKHCNIHVRIGVDGGASTIRVRAESTSLGHYIPTLKVDLVAEANGKIVIAPEIVARDTQHLIDDSLNQLAVKGTLPTDSICYSAVLGMSGSEDLVSIRTFLEELAKDRRLQKAVVVSDAETVWHDVFKKQGIVIIIGTGHVIRGRAAEQPDKQISGFSAPSSDKPSAARFTHDYDDCMDEITLFSSNKIKLFHKKSIYIGQKEFQLFPRAIPFFFAQQMQSGKSDVEQRAFFSMVQVQNNKKYAARAKEMNDYRTNPESSPDFCVEYAWNKAKYDFLRRFDDIAEAGMGNVPFVIQGSMAEPLWDDLSPDEKSSLEPLKIKKKPDALGGALKIAKQLF